MRAHRASILAGIALILAACGGDDPAPALPPADEYTMPVPRPLGDVEGVPLDRALFRVDAGAVQYERDGTRASIGRVATTLSATGASDVDLFDVAAERRGEWTVESGRLRLRDLRALGDARGVVLLPARLVVDAAGRPRAEATIAGRFAEDASGITHGSADVTLGASALRVTGRRAPSGAWDAIVRLDPARLADLHPFLDAIPPHGVARGTIALAGGGGALRARSEGIALSTDESLVHLSGSAARGAGGSWRLDDVRVRLDPVTPEDWRAFLGSDPPIDGPVRGELLADGDGRAGIALRGWVRAEEDAGARLAADVEGTVWLEPQLRADVGIRSRELRLADRGPIDLDLRVAGDADSLVIDGTVRLSAADSIHPLLADLPSPLVERFESATLRVAATVERDGEDRRAVGTAQLVDSAGRVWLDAHGTVPVGGDGVLDVTVVADSLPLALVTAPSAIENLTGYARIRARAQGSLAAAAVEADAELLDVRFDVPQFGTGIDSLTTRLRLAGTRIELDDVRAYRADGSLTLAGGVDLAAPLDLRDPAASFDGASVDVRALLDTMTVVDMDSARAVLAGTATVTGPLRRPHVAAEVSVVDGFVFEGKLAPDPPLDPEDPPYGDLIASAPWPSGTLRNAALAEAAEDAGDTAPPLTADLVARITPGFRIIDEDSDLGALGAVRVVIDDGGTRALGDARIVNGFYAYYGELFQLAGGAFAVSDGQTRLAMSGELRNADRPLGLNQGGYDGLDRRDPPVGIFGYSTPATVLELLRRRTPLPATQPELASLLLFDVPLQPVDTWDSEVMWRGDEPDDLVGQRSALQGAGLAWSWVADELYDYVPLERGYLRAGTIRVGSRYPGWIMLGTHLDAGVHLGSRLTARASHVVGGETWPGVGLRYALRESSLEAADRHVELFHEPRFTTTLGTAGRRDDIDVRRRTGIRLRWFFDY